MADWYFRSKIIAVQLLSPDGRNLLVDRTRRWLSHLLHRMRKAARLHLRQLLKGHMAAVTTTSWGEKIHDHALRYEAGWWGNGWWYPVHPSFDLAPDWKSRCLSGWDGFPCCQRVGHKGPHAASVGGSRICAEWGMKKS